MIKGHATDTLVEAPMLSNLWVQQQQPSMSSCSQIHFYSMAEGNAAALAYVSLPMCDLIRRNLH